MPSWKATWETTLSLLRYPSEGHWTDLMTCPRKCMACSQWEFLCLKPLSFVWGMRILSLNQQAQILDNTAWCSHFWDTAVGRNSSDFTSSVTSRFLCSLLEVEGAHLFLMWAGQALQALYDASPFSLCHFIFYFIALLTPQFSILSSYSGTSGAERVKRKTRSLRRSRDFVRETL